MATIESLAPAREMMLWPSELLQLAEERAEEVSELESEIPLPGDATWWVLHTRSRSEKKIARKLADESVAFFLPLFERRKKLQRRIVRTHLPLFPGYLFLHSNDEGRQIAFDTKLVANCIAVEDQVGIASDLQRILAIIESGAQLAPESRLQPGMPARITKGPMAGMEGTVLRRKSGFRFVVAVDFLQQGAGIEVDDCMVEPI